MKKLLPFTCLALLTVGIASAQTLTFTSKAPFSIGNGNLPAGTYQIQNMGEDLITFRCSNVATGTGVLFDADGTDVTPTASSVTFARYGDKLILKSFTYTGGPGYWVPISIPEKQVKKPGVKPTKVTTPAK